MKCSQCGNDNAGEARFCRKCGHLLMPPTPHSSDDDSIGGLQTSHQITDQDEVTFSEGDMLADRYHVVAFLGQGGMGSVYQVVDKELGETVALKMLAPALMNNARALTRFKQEILICRKLKHPNIVSTYEFSEHRGLKFFTMALVPGHSLAADIDDRRRQAKPFPVERAFEVAHDLLDALAYAHALTVHRDIKPDNVLIDAKGRAIITDFGIAKILEGKRITGTALRVGTAYYMAPEQLLSAALVDHRADLFSVGVLIYEMLTLTLPTGRFSPPSSINPGVPAYADSFILKALEQNPEVRYQSAKAMHEALAGCLDRMKGIAPPPPARAGGPAEGATPGAPSRPSSSQGRAAGAGGLTVTRIAKAQRRGFSATFVLALLLLFMLAAPLGVLVWADQLPAPWPEPVLNVRASVVNFFTKEPLPGNHQLAVPASPVVAAGPTPPVAAPAPPQPAFLDLVTIPAGAKVLFDGKATRLITPAMDIPVTAGQLLKVALVKNGYGAYQTELLPAPGRRQSIRAELTVRTVTLIVITNPPGAQILYAGARRSSTPLVLKGWPCTEPFAFMFRHPDYAEERATHQVAEESCARGYEYVKRTLRPEAGRPRPERGTGLLNFDSTPWGYVNIDGEPANQSTPLEDYQLPEGLHVIEIANPAQDCWGLFKVQISANMRVTQSVRCPSKSQPAGGRP